MDIPKLIEERQKQLKVIGEEIQQLQQSLQQKQVEALKLDGAINMLNELNQQKET